MTLEDFFTLTEMKDGLTALSRVQELVSVMQKEKDCVVKNAGDATRQWAAVASTIAATENKDCLDLFIKLDGLYFIGRWLKDAQKFGNDAVDGFVEESLTALLRALEKLQIDKERSVSSGIWITVNNLLNHGSSRVQDRARALFDSWRQDRVNDATHYDDHHVGEFHDVGLLCNVNNGAECAAVDVPPSKGSADVENNVADSSADETMISTSKSVQSERVEDARIQTQQNMEDKSLDPPTLSVFSNSVPESPSLKNKSSIGSVEGTALAETHIVSDPKGENTELEMDSSKSSSSFSYNAGMIAASSKAELGSSSADAANCKEDFSKSTLQNNVDTKEGDLCKKIVGSGDAGISMSPTKGSLDVVEAVNPCNTPAFKLIRDDRSPGNMDLSDSDRKLGKPELVELPFSHLDDVGVADDDRDHSGDGVEDVRDDSDLSSPVTDRRSPDPISSRRSGIDFDYGIVDALEVACKVAQEVEREVVDYREPSCSSSSGRVVGTDVRQPNSPDSINANQALEVTQEDLPAGENQSANVRPAEDEHLTTSNNVEGEAENGTQEMESSQVTELAPEPEANTEKGFCGFDLNQEVCSDDMDHPMNPISTPISIVSASRPTATSGSPSAPLQFEGILGWKGSAATSAFRPASPRKINDGDKTLETGGTSSSSKQRQDSLVIDLNVVEDGDDKVMDLIPGRPIPVSSGLHSGESSLEVGPRRSERPNLDLNRISDDGDAMASGLRMEGQLFFPWNGNRSPSPASSSSSMQPSLRNFDLNDRPLFQRDASDLRLYHSSHNLSAFGGPKQGDPIISIMGTRVEVSGRVEAGRKDFIPQNTSLPDGKLFDLVADANVARMGGVLGIPTVSYSHSPVFGYNGMGSAPPLSISSAMYGPGMSIPYMVDNRGALLAPQILGSASPAAPSFSQPSLIMGMSGEPVNINGAGSSRYNLDLNSGFAIEGGNTGGLRQLFMPGQSRSVEEHLRSNAQPSSSSGLGGKRKEPDTGWDSYSLPFKHAQPPWR